MARWRQKVDEDGTSHFVPLDQAAADIDGVELNPETHHYGHFVHGDIERFVSPVDGSIIEDRNQLDEHNRRNGVVNASEMESVWEKSRKERERIFKGEFTAQERRQVRQKLYDNWIRAENGQLERRS